MYVLMYIASSGLGWTLCTSCLSMHCHLWNPIVKYTPCCDLSYGTLFVVTNSKLPPCMAQFTSITPVLGGMYIYQCFCLIIPLTLTVVAFLLTQQHSLLYRYHCYKSTHLYNSQFTYMNRHPVYLKGELNVWSIWYSNLAPRVENLREKLKDYWTMDCIVPAVFW